MQPLSIYLHLYSTSLHSRNTQRVQSSNLTKELESVGEPERYARNFMHDLSSGKLW